MIVEAGLRARLDSFRGGGLLAGVLKLEADPVDIKREERLTSLSELSPELPNMKAGSE